MIFDFAQRTSSIARIVLVILYAANLWNGHSLVGNLDKSVVDNSPAIVTGSLNVDGDAGVLDDLYQTIKDDKVILNTQVKDDNDKEQWHSHEPRAQNNLEPVQTITCTSLSGNGTTWSVPAFPHLIIVGAAKAGTTALSHFLGQAPNFQRSKQSEPHFWDGVLHGKTIRHWSSHVQRCKLLQQYHSYWSADQIGPETITFEKTPSLLAMSSKASMIRALLDPNPPKIIIVLRNPIDRFYSNYRMNYQRNRGMASHSIAENVQLEVAKLRNLSFIDVPTLSSTTKTWNQSDFVALPLTSRDFDWRWSMVARGFYAPQIERYMRYFPLGTSLKVIQYENFTQHKVETLNDILEWLGAPRYYNWSSNELEQHYGPVRKSRTKVHPMPSKIKKYLEHLYHPFNERLAALLGEQWRGVWDNEN